MDLYVDQSAIHWLIYAVLMGIFATYFMSSSLSIFTGANTESYSEVVTERQSLWSQLTLTNMHSHYHRWVPAKTLIILLYAYVST